MRSTRLVLVAVTAFLLLAGAGAYAAYWFALAGQVESGVARWIEERRAEGYTVRHGPIQRGGFPFALSLQMAAPEIERGGERPLRWKAESLSASAKPWELADVTVKFPGRHLLLAPIEGKQRPIDAMVGEGRLDLLLDGRGQARAADLSLAQVAARLTDTNEHYGVATLRAVVRRRDAAGASAGPADVSLETDTRIASLVLPPGRAGPLGPEISVLNLLANVVGQAPPALTAEAVAKWRDAGGYIDIKEAQINWGGFEVRGAGTLRFDANLQPLLELNSRVRGWDVLVGALMAQGQLKPLEAIGIMGVLTALSRPADDGGAPQVRVPLAVRDGRVYLHSFRIWRLPPLVWR